jgi:hypothetical protein
MGKKKKKDGFEKVPAPKKAEERHYVRLRPDSGGTFYAPSADIVNTLQPALSHILKVMYPEDGTTYPASHPSRALALDLAHFIKSAYASNVTWDLDGVNQLNQLLDNLDPEDATKFLYMFFMAMMDYFWHGCRLETGDPSGDPEDMARAIGMSQILRTMPKAMREEYLDHLKSHNMLPHIMYKGAMLRKVLEDTNDQ